MKQWPFSIIVTMLMAMKPQSSNYYYWWMYDRHTYIHWNIVSHKGKRFLGAYISLAEKWIGRHGQLGEGEWAKNPLLSWFKLKIPRKIPEKSSKNPDGGFAGHGGSLQIFSMTMGFGWPPPIGHAWLSLIS